MKKYADYLADIEALKAKADEVRRREAVGVIKRIREAIDQYQITNEELFGPPEAAKRKRAAPAVKGKAKPHLKLVRPPKFRDPETGETWSGQGTTARWLRAKEDAGISREQFRINKDESKAKATG